MKITPSDVKAYQKIYLAHHGKSMENDVAYRQLQKLVLQTQLIYKAIKLDDIKELNEALSIEIVKNEPRTEDDF